MKTKSNILIAFAIIAVGFVSFISGRLSVGENSTKVETVRSEQGSVKDLSINPIPNPSSDGNVSSTSSLSGENMFVASKNGEKYFPISCGSAKTIKPENAIYFKSGVEAELSGKTKSVQCKY